MQLLEKINSLDIILASNSARRKELLHALGVRFSVQTLPTSEAYPQGLQAQQIPQYIAQQKAVPFLADIRKNQVIITADTIVWHQGKALGKPANFAQAQQMLASLSGKVHQVISALCLSWASGQKTLCCTTQVHFRPITPQEIEYYLTHFQPWDKAGSYGIQDWIGAVAVERSEGSYNNVVGLPTQLLLPELQTLAQTV